MVFDITHSSIQAYNDNHGTHNISFEKVSINSDFLITEKVVVKTGCDKFIGGVTLENFLVLPLGDPHHLDGDPWSYGSTR